ncbi:unnamed protein product [Polarella glacialis]|uniref:Uncharacterized protein n=1 Tax=Polarella glacialis TaxID=89957 RepID=A0A813EWG4_POLGL|nr:unnamed protein product [Polarella glacialis]CAE8715458.1 unnamed protein product [Polarella glacialis]
MTPIGFVLAICWAAPVLRVDGSKSEAEFALGRFFEKVEDLVECRTDSLQDEASKLAKQRVHAIEQLLENVNNNNHSEPERGHAVFLRASWFLSSGGPAKVNRRLLMVTGVVALSVSCALALLLAALLVPKACLQLWGERNPTRRAKQFSQADELAAEFLPSRN